MMGQAQTVGVHLGQRRRVSTSMLKWTWTEGLATQSGADPPIVRFLNDGGTGQAFPWLYPTGDRYQFLTFSVNLSSIVPGPLLGRILTFEVLRNGAPTGLVVTYGVGSAGGIQRVTAPANYSLTPAGDTYDVRMTSTVPVGVQAPSVTVIASATIVVRPAQ